MCIRFTLTKAVELHGVEAVEAVAAVASWQGLNVSWVLSLRYRCYCRWVERGSDQPRFKSRQVSWRRCSETRLSLHISARLYRSMQGGLEEALYRVVLRFVSEETLDQKTVFKRPGFPGLSPPKGLPCPGHSICLALLANEP